MAVNGNAERLKLLLEFFSSRLTRAHGYDYTADVKTYAAECVDKPHDFLIVGYAGISATLILLDRVCRDGNYDLSLILHGKEHFYLAVRAESGKHA